MKMIEANTKEPAVVPVIRYRDLPAAVGWLCKAFGFEKQRIVVDRNGVVSFAQLTYGGSLIMVGAVRASAFDKLMKQPDEVGGAETQVCYLFVADARVHCTRAAAAGAEIVFQIEDRENGGRSYTCRDPEGHLWNFGTYNPWLHHVSGRVPARGPRHRKLAKRLLLIGGLMTSVAAVIMPGNTILDAEGFESERAAIETGSIATLEDPPVRNHPLRNETDDADAPNAAAITEQLARTQQETAALRKAADETRERLLQATRNKEIADRLVKDLRDRLDKTSVELRQIRQRMKKNATAGVSTWEFP
jgi:uncharacterized glyoxalase superfamily protein PhnB